MMDHLGIYVRDAEASLGFYRAALAPLGIKVVEEQGGGKAAIFMRDGSPGFFLWLGEGGGDARSATPGKSPVHLGFVAANRQEVDAFHAAALGAGGTDNGRPGFRNPKVYQAFAYDPDGNNVEAIWRPA